MYEDRKRDVATSGRKLAAQLYTVREFTTTKQGFEETLEKVANIGYTGVQLSAVKAMDGDAPAVTATEARRYLDENGLICAGTHRSWVALKSNIEAEIEFHRILGCEFTAIGSLPEEYRSTGAEGYTRFLAEAKPVIAQLKAAGIRFGYHNHDFEFARVSPEKPGALLDILIEQGGEDLCMELDLYWAWHAGVDPSTLLQRCAGRVPLIHIKDKEVVAGKGPIMAAIGEGNLPWDIILPAADAAGVEWLTVEQDVCPRDPFDCLRSSFEYLTVS